MPNKEIGDETFKHGNVRFPAKKRRITEQVAVNAARHQRGHRREHGAVASCWHSQDHLAARLASCTDGVHMEGGNLVHVLCRDDKP